MDTFSGEVGWGGLNKPGPTREQEKYRGSCLQEGSYIAVLVEFAA